MISQQYWAKRIADSQTKIADKSIAETQKQLKKYYKKTMKSVISDFEAVMDKMIANVEEGKAPTANQLYQMDKYWQMQAQLKNKLQKLGDKEIGTFSKRFEETYTIIYNSIALPSDYAFAKASEQAAKQTINNIWAADGKSWSQRIWDNTNTLQETLNEKLIDCVVAGKKTTELKQELQYRFGVSYNAADRLVRTETARIQCAAAQDCYKAAGLEKYEVLVGVDERTCPECAELEGKQYDINSLPPIPAHPGCRCCIVPVLD